MNLKKILFGTSIALIVFSGNLSLGACKYQVQPKSVKLKWTGYKTPAKAGVSGVLDSITLTNFKQAASIEDSLSGLKFSIKSNSVNSAPADSPDKVRDIRIYTMLLGGKDGKITGSFISKKEKQLLFKVTLNGNSVDVPLSYKIKGNKLRASGHVDLFDFALSEKLKEFTKACLAKHEGKTWSDVKVKLSVDFSKKCS